MSSDRELAPVPPVPEGLQVEWAPRLDPVYRTPSASLGPRRVVRRWSRRSHARTAWASALGLALGVALFVWGVQHARVRVILEGCAFAVMMALLLDRVAPRLRSRTVVEFLGDTLDVRQLPADGATGTRLARRELLGFRVETVAEPLAARSRTGYQVNALLTEGRVEPVFPAVESRDEAEWLRAFLAAHAGLPDARLPR